MFWLLLGTAFGCDEVVDADAFLADVSAAWVAAIEDRSADARDIVLGLEAKLGCLSKPLTADQSALFHRAEAVKALHEGDERGAAMAASAAARLAPDATWGDAHAKYNALELSTSRSSEGFATSLAAKVFVDGTATSSRPLGSPVVVQIFAPDGTPVAGGWVKGSDPLPSWVAFPPVSCETAVNVDQIVADVDRASSAYADLDVNGFEAALHGVAAGIPCVTGRVSLSQAAAIHRLEGIRLFISGSESSAIRSFQQAHTLNPGYHPPEALVPPGSTLDELWVLSKNAPPSPWLSVTVPDGLRLVVDGLSASQRPAATPAIIQIATPSGQVLLSRYVPPGAGLPDLSSLSATAASAERDRLSPAMQLYREENDKRAARLRRTQLSVAGVITLTAAGVLYFDNALANLEHDDPHTPHTRLEALRKRANNTASVSSVLLISGTGIMVGTLFVR